MIVLFYGLFTGVTAFCEPFTADILVRLDRVGSPVLSPDGSRVVYDVRTTGG